jgi:hypothetical protein
MRLAIRGFALRKPGVGGADTFVTAVVLSLSGVESDAQMTYNTPAKPVAKPVST